MKKSKYQAIRKEIKLRAEASKIWRLTRKTVHSTLSPEQEEKLFERRNQIRAELGLNWWDGNTCKLRHLYIAYQIIKGKEPVYPTKKYYNEALTQKLVEKFTPKVEEAA